MGSSGVRAGTDKAVITPGVDIDVLAYVVAGGRIDTTLAETVTALRELPVREFAPLAASLPGPVTLTAISRPVTRGIHPALQRLAQAGSIDPALVDAQGFAAAAVTAALAVLAPIGSEARAQATGLGARFAPYLLSDLLLTEGILRATDAARLEVDESAVTNLPGLLADERAFAWAARHDCYLARLRELGEAAYTDDPARCE